MAIWGWTKALNGYNDLKTVLYNLIVFFFSLTAETRNMLTVIGVNLGKNTWCYDQEN